MLFQCPTLFQCLMIFHTLFQGQYNLWRCCYLCFVEEKIEQGYFCYIGYNKNTKNKQIPPPQVPPNYYSVIVNWIYFLTNMYMTLFLEIHSNYIAVLQGQKWYFTTSTYIEIKLYDMKKSHVRLYYPWQIYYFRKAKEHF